MSGWRVRRRRIGAIVAGLFFGLLFVGLAFWFYTQAAREGALRIAFQQALNLPPTAFQLESISEGRVRITARAVALLDEAGDTVIGAPLAHFRLDPRALEGDGPIVFTDVELRDPSMRLVQSPAGEWNIARITRATAAGEDIVPAEEVEGRALVFAGVRVTGGRVSLATPWTPSEEGEATAPAEFRLAQVAGIPYRIRTVQALNARLPEVRVGGQAGWRVEVADLDARLTDPDVRVAQLRGAMAEAPDGFRFALQTLRTDHSELGGSGQIRTVGETMQIDAQIAATPVDFRDLRWFSALVPPEGAATLALDIATRPDGRTTYAVRDAEIVAPGSRAAGRVTVVMGGDQPPTFMDTELLLDPLDLALLDAFGLGEQVPFEGQVRGRVATIAEVEGLEGPLAVDLVATVTPRGLPDVPVSTLAAEGALAFVEDEGVRLDGLRVSVRPLHLAALRPLLPEQEERLRGMVVGSVLLSGTPRSIRIDDGDLAYEVGTAPATRLAALSGAVTLEPELRYEVDAIVQPLALATVAEIAPAFPFRRTSLAGQVQLSGTAEGMQFSTNLRGEPGGFETSGSFVFGEPLSFRVAGQLQALLPARLLRQDLPFAGPISGPFLLEGTTEDLGFDVDFTQAEGRFALAGRVRLPDGPPVLDVAGQVTEFRVGTLIGRTGLFASPLTGDIRLSGGGRQPYLFDVGLRGERAALDVEGWVSPLDVPTYAFSGTIGGLDLGLVPGLEQMPRTNLNAVVAVEGAGTDPESMTGRLSFDASASTVGGMRLQAATAQMAVDAGVLRLDTLALALAGTRLVAAGAWGITRPAAEPLRFSLVSPNLAALTPVLVAMQRVEPQLTGAINATGTVAGTLENPIINASARGRNLRLDGWRAASLALDVDASLTPEGWSGEATVDAENALLAGREALQAIRVQAVGTPEAVSVGLLARRDRTTDLTLSGTLEMEEQVPQGLALQALALRLNGSLWQLQAPTGVRWGEIAGVEVDSLVLRRTFTGTERQAQRAGAVVEEGWIEMDGRLPPTGALDFRVRATNVDVGELRQLVPNAPQIEGVLTLEASLEGPSAAPELFLDARIANLRFRDIDVEALAVSARYADGGATADAALWQNGVQVGNAQGTIPMQLAFENLLPQIELLDAQPVSARVVADSIPFGLLAAAIPGAVQGTGVVAGELTVGGPLGTPDLQGWATVAGGGITLTELGVRYEEIDARVAMQGQSIQVESLTARSGGGVALSGVIQVDDRTRPQLDLSASFNQFRAIDRANVASIAISGPVTLTGRFPTPVLSGRVELSSGTITLPAIEDRDVFEITDVDVGEIGEGALPAEALEPTLVEQIRISGLEITIGDGVWAVSPEARVQLGGELVVSRLSPVEWQVFGDLLARRGSYTLSIGPLVREFDVVSGRIEFFGTPDLNPSLDILAQHRIRTASAGAGGSPTLNILVQITGSVQFPRIQLTSDTQPPLPESELLSYLIFGRPTFALGEVGGGLAQQLILQELAGGVVATQVEQLIQQAGLPFDYVRVRGRPTPTGFGPTALGATTIELGWQIAPEVFWTVEWGVGRLFGGDLGDSWGASLEWQIDPQWSVRGAWEPLRRDLLLQPLGTNLTRQFSLDLRRRWEYGFTPAEPRVPLATEEAQPSSAPAPAVPPEREPDR